MDLLFGTCILFLLVICVMFLSGAQEKSYVIQEEVAENVFIGDLTKDLAMLLILNKSLNIPMRFKLVQKTGEVALVHIEEDTGKIFTTKERIDREKLCPGIHRDAHCFYEVEVAILPDEIFKLVKIRFRIEDINDNSPLFPSTVLYVSIPENSALNSQYPFPAANDPDVGKNGVQNYQLIQSQNVFGLDIVESPEGVKVPRLIVQKELDREEKDIYIVKVKVEDGGTPPRSSTAILQVRIDDANDNQPVFKENTIEVNIPENAPVGSSVTQLHATDADIGENAKIQFSFSNLVSNIAKRLFDLNNNTGLITIKEPLDREESPNHKLVVLASDGGLKPDRAMVIVNVTDVNDNVPSIDIRHIINPVNGTVVLSENTPLNTKIALITVTDKDADDNGRVSCFIDADVPFRLKPVFDNQFLLETTNYLDYEATKEYVIKLLATDAGKPPLNQSSTLVIKVKDENDNAPVITQSFITVSVPENNPPGMQLTKISAMDADTGRNAEISYLLGADAPTEFSLDRRTGILTAMKELDREKQEKYVFSALAKDNGIPPLTSNVTVVVTVLDENDNTPTFTHNDYNFYVSENLPRHERVGLITARDLDYGDNSVVTLSIVDGNDEFTIDAATGAIQPNILFDREKQESYTFYVKAEDGGRLSRSSTTKVTINVVDVNDNKPVFLVPPSNYSYELVPPSTNPGTVVFTVVASDDDTGRNAELRYNIVEGNLRGLFAIDQVSGNITMQEKCAVGDRGLHKLVVKAQDLGQPDSLSSAAVVNLFVNETVTNTTMIHELVNRSTELPVTPNIEIAGAPSPNTDYVKVIASAVAATTMFILVIAIIFVAKYCQSIQCKASQKNKQNSEWATPNPENVQRMMKKKKKKSKRKHAPQSFPLNFVTIEEMKADDADNDNGLTEDRPSDLEQQIMSKYNWGTTPTTFKPDSPDLARHYKSTSPQPAFHIEPETPLNPKHHIIQELPHDNTFVASDSISKCSSSSSDPYSISECSYSATTFQAPVTVHTRPPMKENIRFHTLMKEATTAEVWVHPQPQQRKSEGKKTGKSQRRVTFHLPEGSQDSSDDGGRSSLPSTSHALALGYGQEEHFDHAVRFKRSEGDGKSDPELTVIPGLKKAAEIIVQPTVEEASDNCTPECLILGHSDACWMPASMTQTPARRHSPQVAQTFALCPSPQMTQAIRMEHRLPPAQASTLSYSPGRAQAEAQPPSPPQPLRALQRGWGQEASPEGLPAPNQEVPGGTRAQFAITPEAHPPSDDDSPTVISLTTFTPGPRARASRDDSPIMEEDPL